MYNYILKNLYMIVQLMSCINNYTQLCILFYYRLRSGSEIAERDIVQFVPFRDFKQVQKYYYHNTCTCTCMYKHIFVFPLA